MKKHIPFFILVCVLAVSCVVVRSSPQNAYATEPIARIKLSTAILEKDNLDTISSEEFYLSAQGSEVKDLGKDYFSLGANDSLYYIFEVSNLSDENIECELMYVQNCSENFAVTYSFNTEESTLTSTRFFVEPCETKLLFVHIFVEDLSLDAQIDGCVSLVVFDVAEGAQ